MREARYSLRRRLELGLGATIAALVLLAGFGGNLAVRQVAEELALARLRHDAESVLGGLRFGDVGEPALEPRRLASFYQRPYSGHYYVALAGTGRELRSRSLWDAELAVSALAPGEERQWHVTGPLGQPLLVWSGGFRKAQREITVAVAEDMSALHARLAALRGWWIAGGLAVLLAVLTVLRVILRRAFAPVQAAAAELERVGHGEIRQIDEQVPDEVRGLVVAVNRLLRLLEQRVERYRNAAGNLAHALKTPLSLLSQVADDQALREHPGLAQEVRERVRQIRQSVDSELRRARLAGRAAGAPALELRADVEGLIAVLQRVYEGKGLRIALDMPDELRVFLDRDDLLELLGNLLDNACKWATSRVACRLAREGVLQVLVEDDGPGCAPAELERITARGQRLDEDVPGHGIGLSIVRDVVALYGGRLAFDRSPQLGGLRVTVRLPMGQHGLVTSD